MRLSLFCIFALTTTSLLATRLMAQSPISRVLFGSCIKQERPTPIFFTMKAMQPELLIFTGDNIYADTTDMTEMRAKYAALAGNRSFQGLIADRPTLATWDDHDFGVNDGGATYSKRVESQKEFLDFWGVDVDSPRRKREGTYHSQIFGPAGKRLQVICLDTRYFRSPLKSGKRRVGGPYYPDDSADKTMLGEVQWKWLAEQLRQPAEIRVVISSIQFVASAAGQECWANLPLQREKMLSLLRQSKASGVIFISGDRHWSEFSCITDEVPYPVYDLTCSSFNQSHGRGTPTENAFRVSETTYHKENFGVLEIDWQKSDPQLKFSIRDIEGTQRIQKTLALSELRP